MADTTTTEQKFQDLVDQYNILILRSKATDNSDYNVQSALLTLQSAFQPYIDFTLNGYLATSEIIADITKYIAIIQENLDAQDAANKTTSGT